ncbi:MAG: AMP-binding protein [bacterium]
MKTKELKLFDVPKITSIQEMVLNNSQKYFYKLALEDLNNTPIPKLTYGELLENILKFGHSLQTLGIKERAHIAIIGENRVQWAVSFLTCMCFNYVVVPIDKNLTENEIFNIIYESDSEAIIFSEAFCDMLSKVSTSKKLKHFICMDETSADDSFLIMKTLIDNSAGFNQSKLPKIDPDDLAEIIFTSGSLGRAKGVMLSQKNLASNLIDMVSMLFMYPEDKFLSVLPIHHTYECTCGMLCPLYSGSSVHYARSLKTIIDDLQRVKATMFLGVPLLFDKMFKRISKSIKDDKIKSKIVPPLVKITNFASFVGWKELKKKVFHEMHQKFGGSLRIFIAGGAAPDPMVAKGLREFGFSFLQGYGLTECSPIVALNRLNDFKDDAAGIPLPGVEVKINEPDNDGIGEIWVKGPNVMLGYYKNPAQTKTVFSNDWFKTGDIGFFDDDSFLHICGRMKNVIISKSGKNVFPEEVEDILNRSPFILECFVYGEKDSKQDELIACKIVVDAEAVIQAAEKANIQITSLFIDEIIKKEIKIANDELPSYKQIKKYHIQEQEFEKTTTQKIKRYLINNNQQSE